MSIANTIKPVSQASLQEVFSDSTSSMPLSQVVEELREVVTPLWPLQDYIATNPFWGFSDRKFLETRKQLLAISDVDLFMPATYYQDRFAEGALTRFDISSGVDELVEDGIAGAERIDVNQICAYLSGEVSAEEAGLQTHFRRQSVRSIASMVDRRLGTKWNAEVCEEISKHCADHYDKGQSTWSSPWKKLPLFQAWRSAAAIDRNFELLGVKGVRKLVKSLPHDAETALTVLLTEIGVPKSLWKPFLHSSLLEITGWSAWTRYIEQEAKHAGQRNDDFMALMAMRLTYELALANQFRMDFDWRGAIEQIAELEAKKEHIDDELMVRYALLKASEIAYRRVLLSGIGNAQTASQNPEVKQPLAQMVFCIDVRSERMRRQIEAQSTEIQTFGFAGFFGIASEVRGLGETQGEAMVPFLARPQFNIQKSLSISTQEQTEVIKKRGFIRSLRRSWKDWQSFTSTCFGFVESSGLLHTAGLVARSFKLPSSSNPQHDGLTKHQAEELKPSWDSIDSSLDEKVDLAESILRGIGVTQNFGKLFVFCGHGSCTQNNPLKAGLDCGACGGHAGDSNARLAANLLNSSEVRDGLKSKGINVGEDTVFVAALHNTTTDKLEFFDQGDLSSTQQAELEKLKTICLDAGQQTLLERAEVFSSSDTQLAKRALDWSEVRPEWGLAGNAAFVAGPRSLTASSNLDSRAFLHSYDENSDEGLAVLKQIVSAPVVVAHWINMQYYASTVCPKRYGSGTKTMHNVLGKFGILQGTGGDLMTGLPTQSLHDGKSYQHHPLRLLVVLAASRSAIRQVMEELPQFENLAANGWIQLVAVEKDKQFRFTKQKQWQLLNPEQSETTDTAEMLEEV